VRKQRWGSLPMQFRNCQHCGAVIVSAKPRFYCSRRCGVAAWRKRHPDGHA
jgi:hypothetical protein